jgi:hypothetical protein
MNKRFIWTVIILLALGTGIFFLTRRTKEEGSKDTQEAVDEVEREEGKTDEEEQPKYEYTGETDFSTFTTDTQTLGEESEVEFSIESLIETSKDGYHEFIFTLKTEDEEGQPYVVSSFISNMSVVRVDFQGISKDSTGIGYQQEKLIEKDGVTKIYHNISAQQDQELYDIGVTRSTPFELTSEEISQGEWNVTLKVKYPGERTVEIDMGSTEFSTEDQTIEGISATENASITSYTYGSSSGIMKLVWSVGGQGDNPIPSVIASYNDDDELIVTFESLSVDRVSNISETMTLPFGITATPERTEQTSVYTFSGMDGRAEFRLSALLSPNQVILEIK